VATGFNETKWQTMLSDAGYPKTPPPRTSALGKPATPPPFDAKTTQVVTPEVTPKGSYPQ